MTFELTHRNDSKKDKVDTLTMKLRRCVQSLEDKGYDTKFLDDYVTTEEFDAQRSKDRLLELGAEQGFLTKNDLKDAPLEVRNDKDVQDLLKGESLPVWSN